MALLALIDNMNTTFEDEISLVKLWGIVKENDNRVSKNEKSCHFSSMRLKRLLLKRWQDVLGLINSVHIWVLVTKISF